MNVVRPVRRPHPAVALVLVITLLALVTLLVMAMMSQASTESRSASTASRVLAARSLADTAVNLAVAQVRLGTGIDGHPGTGSGVWVSQPGMIRTYTATGAPDTVVRLYSAAAMTDSAGAFSPQSDAPPPDWNQAPFTGLFADINRPAFTTAGGLAYPVLDPPSPDPGDADFVEGFFIHNAPGHNPGRAPSPGNNPAPMPVRWIYVLEDSTLVAPTLSGGLVEVPGATQDNPIVGRVAFWTDDESSKVNVNTASEGTYWDVPRTYSLEDVGRFGGGFSATDPQIDVPGYSITQPAQREFQRYPGHPATTSLSPIFGGLLPVPAEMNINDPEGYAAAFDPYYRLVPRTHAGGSAAGTRISTSPLEVETDRLVASTDEFGLEPGRQPQPYFHPTAVRRRGFFLTSTSSAPEVTLFNTPRIAMWPAHVNPARRTAYDALVAFCSNIGGHDYFINRSNARSVSADLSPRNLELYRYLQELTARDVPGFGGNFLAKYGPGPAGISDRDQILTQIVDYIRSTNLQDRSQGATPFTPLYTSWGGTLAAGEVMPLRIGQTQGFGRFYSISEACLLFHGTHRTSGRTNRMRAVFMLEFASPMQGMGAARKHTKYRVTGLQHLQVDAGDGWRSLNFRPDGTNFLRRSDLATFHGRDIGGTEGPNQALLDEPGSNKSFADSAAGSHAPGDYPFFTPVDFEIPASNEGTFRFSAQGQPVIVEVRAADTDELIQTIHLEFPDGEFKVPGVAGGGDTHAYGSRNFQQAFPTVNSTDTVVGLQIAGAVTDPDSPAYLTDSTAGDTRMIQSLPVVPASRFRPHDRYFQPGVQFAHSLLTATGHPFHGATFGTLVPVPNYHNWRIQRQPDLPPCVGTQVTRVDGGPGDWDSGFGDQKDGAHINKPDEGDTALYDNQSGMNRPPYMLGHGQGFAAATNVFFSPNRQIPSAMMLGSIPTGVQRLRPWQTLLFHSRPEDPTHPGRASPPDHLIADLFWMPVVEPYAVSQPLATSGKVNMNYQIQPFGHIHRDTAVRSVLRSTRFLALPLEDVHAYKPLDPGNHHTRAPNRRHSIDADATLAAFEARFAADRLFRSATEICEIDLVPAGYSGSMAAFWQNHRLTGDNVREKPYADIYPRLTTRSNVFTVHVVAESLRKSRASVPDRWDPERDVVTSRYRGSSVLERYIDFADPALPDFAAAGAGGALPDLSRYYRIRIVSSDRFIP